MGYKPLVELEHLKNKLAKPRRHVLEHFRLCTLGFEHVGHYVGHLVGHHVSYHFHLHVGQHVSNHIGHRNVVLTLCEVSQTLTEWKSESITYCK